MVMQRGCKLSSANIWEVSSVGGHYLKWWERRLVVDDRVLCLIRVTKEILTRFLG
jgi:hypothetical protein